MDQCDVNCMTSVNSPNVLDLNSVLREVFPRMFSDASVNLSQSFIQTLYILLGRVNFQKYQVPMCAYPLRTNAMAL